MKKSEPPSFFICFCFFFIKEILEYVFASFFYCFYFLNLEICFFLLKFFFFLKKRVWISNTSHASKLVTLTNKCRLLFESMPLKMSVSFYRVGRDNLYTSLLNGLSFDLNTVNLATVPQWEYSPIPNKHAEANRHVWWKILLNLINMQSLINMYSGSFFQDTRKHCMGK